jgi:hypothetical protein
MGTPDEDGRKGRLPRSVGQLLMKAKWEKSLADWIAATGVGLVGPVKQDFEAERVEMTDGEVSHLSEIKLPCRRTGVSLVLFLFFLFFFWFSFP